MEEGVEDCGATASKGREPSKSPSSLRTYTQEQKRRLEQLEPDVWKTVRSLSGNIEAASSASV